MQKQAKGEEISNYTSFDDLPSNAMRSFAKLGMAVVITLFAIAAVLLAILSVIVYAVTIIVAR